jgi:hypothetical protein
MRAGRAAVRGAEHLARTTPVPAPSSQNPLYLVVCHDKRILLNHYLMDKTGLFIPAVASDTAMASQDMWLSPGDLVIGASKVNKGVLNGAALSGWWTTSPHRGEERNASELQLTPQLEDAARFLRPGQGSGLLHDPGRTIHLGRRPAGHRPRPLHQPRILNVGMTRAHEPRATSRIFTPEEDRALCDLARRGVKRKM